MNSQLIVRCCGRRPYWPVWQAMRAFTQTRSATQVNEVWLTEHDPVFTLGLAGKSEHILDRGGIEVVHSDRGGQVSYHGPGQLLLYTLFDLKRQQMTVRQWVGCLEGSVIALLAKRSIKAYSKAQAPGVYVQGAKIAALGLRIKRGCCYHGLSLNVAMELQPFRQINPCGFPGLAVTDLAALHLASLATASHAPGQQNANIKPVVQLADLGMELVALLAEQLGIDEIIKLAPPLLGKSTDHE